MKSFLKIGFWSCLMLIVCFYFTGCSTDLNESTIHNYEAEADVFPEDRDLSDAAHIAYNDMHDGITASPPEVMCHTAFNQIQGTVIVKSGGKYFAVSWINMPPPCCPGYGPPKMPYREWTATLISEGTAFAYCDAISA